jgi:hypothetical protein
MLKEASRWGNAVSVHSDSRNRTAERLDCHGRHRRRNRAEIFHDRVDRLVAEVTEEAGFPVVQAAGRKAAIEHRLDLAVVHRRERVRRGTGEVSQRTQDLLGHIDGSHIADRDGEHLVAVGSGQEDGVGHHFVRRMGQEIPVEPKPAPRLLQRQKTTPPAFARPDEAGTRTR